MTQLEIAIMNKQIRTILMLAGVLAIAGVLIAGNAGAEENREIRVTGIGEVLAQPDMATISLGVVSEAETAGDALARNSDIMAKLVASLKADGIASRDLQTSGFSVQPNFVYPDRNRGETGEPRITGYTVRNMLSVRVRDLARTGEFLDRMVSLGSNSVNNISFSVADPGPVEDSARQAAVTDARARAELYAAAAGLKLGRIVLISEPQAVSRPPVNIRARASLEAASAVPVQAGELTFRAQVNIVWEIE